MACRVQENGTLNIAAGKWTQSVSPVVALERLTDDEVQDLCALKNQHWCYSLQEQRRWWDDNSDCTDLVVRLFKAERLVAFLRLRARMVTCEGVERAARCATEVCVDRNFQRCGIGRALMQEATQVLDRESQPLGYLLCTPEQEDFYAKCGWSRVTDVVIRSGPCAPARPVGDMERCFIYDPTASLRGRIVLTGKIF